MLRLIDANLDRLSEGLRVLEDIARFLFGDIQTTETLKSLRHKLTTTDPAFKNRLLTARDSSSDVGRESHVERTERKHLIDLVTANAKRVQESLRVLEEFAKLPEAPDGIANLEFEQARFTLYEIERDIILQLSRANKRERINGLYVIIDAQALAGRNMVDVAQQVADGGASIVQLRNKLTSKRDLIAAASKIREICAKAGILFIVNDHVDVALASDADGVHLGQTDIPLTLAREILPPDKLIGCSARSVEKAIQAQEEGADYLGVGSIYPSSTKLNAKVIGLEGLREIRNAITLPIVAIGGISEINANEVFEHGADCLAVISAVSNTEDIKAATNKLAGKISERGVN